MKTKYKVSNSDMDIVRKIGSIKDKEIAIVIEQASKNIIPRSNNLMIKCNLEMCTNCNNGICSLNEITIDKYYDNELGYFIGGSCKDLKIKQSYLDKESERTFKLMKIQDDIYYAVRTSVFDDVDVDYILNKYPDIKILITDNLIIQGTKVYNRFWIYTFGNDDLKGTSVCDKYNKLITNEMLKFTCDYIRESKNYGCLTSIQEKMIMKGIDL